MSKLYLIPTPIGNLEDITLRALNLLKEVDIILAEDTRTSSKLLKHYDIHTPMQSYHLFNEHKVVDSWVQRIKGGTTIALITDAGTPAISILVSCSLVLVLPREWLWNACQGLQLLYPL